MESGKGHLSNPGGFSLERVESEQSVEASQTKQQLERQWVRRFLPADATPDVSNVERFIAGNTGANNLTYFDKGQDGQTIKILGDGFTTVVHNVTKIKTNTAADKPLDAGKVYTFTRFNKIWVEDA